MGNILYDLADYGLSTEEVAKSIIEKLRIQYNENFKIMKIGERYGTGINNEVTAICSIEGCENFLFRVKYDMVKEKIIEDNFFLRCTCFYIEKEFKEFFKNIKIIVRVELEKKNKIDNIYRIEEFIRKFPKENFIVTLVLEKNETYKINEIIENLCRNYENLHFSMLIYEMDIKDFEKFYSESKNIDEISMSYIESFSSCKRKILKKC